MKHLRNLLLPLIGVTGLAMLVWAGFMPDHWMRRHLPPGIDPGYPLQAVLSFCAIVLLECSLLYALLRPTSYHRSWGRALCACLLALVIAVAWLSGFMHAPPYYGMHLQWWLLVTLSVMLLALYSSAQALWQRRMAGK